MNHNHRLAPYLTLNLAVLFWGLSFVAIKIALESFSPFTLIFIRFSIASVFFLGAMLYRGFPAFTRKEHGQVLVAALFQPGLYFIFETNGLQYTSASKAGLIVATIPIAVLCLSMLFLNERPTWPVIFGIGLSLVGIAMLIADNGQVDWSLGGSMLGDVLMLGAVISMAIYTVSLKRLVHTRSSFDITGLQVFYGALFFTPAFMWEVPHIQWATISIRSLLALACLILFATIAAFLCFNYALKKIPASKTAIFLNNVPVVTAIGAWTILGERLTPLQIAGGAVVLFSVYLTNFGDKLVNTELRKVLSLNFEGRGQNG